MKTGGVHDDFTLLVDGKAAFPALLESIARAKKKIWVNMFIWRDDAIGNRIAEAVLAAADRGVFVFLSVDRYGVLLEKCEECKRSFFHKHQSLVDRIKIKTLELLYPMEGTPRRQRDTESPLYQRILIHPNIRLDCDRSKEDHSKYYVIDDEILFLGGINIEDKENGADMQGRVYQDYMVKIVGAHHVAAFLDKIRGVESETAGYSFCINRKLEPRCFEVEQFYLDMIASAKRELRIIMAYFSPLPRFLHAIADAHARGVAVTVMIPARANLQNDSNYKAVKKLMRATDNGIRLLLSPKMVHTKMIITEHQIAFGSANITKKAFTQLDELNLNVERNGSAFCERLLESVVENEALCKQIKTAKELHYHHLLAILEGFLV